MKYNKDDFLNKLIAHEGLRLGVYKDTLGINTVGIGRNLDDRGISKEELDWMDIPSIDHIFSDGITEADAMYLAQNDVQIVEEELVRAHPCVDELDAVRQLVLMDMAFNMGVPRLCKFKKMWAAIHENKFDEAGGDMVMAKKMAGYADSSGTAEIVKGLKEEILEATQMYMARNAPKAAIAMTGALYDPTELGIRDKMSAAKELLDRVGLVKTEKMQVEASGGVMLMPPKAPVEDDD